MFLEKRFFSFHFFVEGNENIKRKQNVCIGFQVHLRLVVTCQLCSTVHCVLEVITLTLACNVSTLEIQCFSVNIWIHGEWQLSFKIGRKIVNKLFDCSRIITKTGMQNLIQHSMVSMVPSLKNGSKAENLANNQGPPLRTGEQV